MSDLLTQIREFLDAPLGLPVFLRPLLLIPYAIRVIWRHVEGVLERARAPGRLFGPLEQALAAWQGGFFGSPALTPTPYAQILHWPSYNERAPALYRSRRTYHSHTSHHRHSSGSGDSHSHSHSHSTSSSHTSRFNPPTPPRPGSIDELYQTIRAWIQDISIPHVLLALLIVNVVLLMLPEDVKRKVQDKCRTAVFGPAPPDPPPEIDDKPKTRPKTTSESKAAGSAEPAETPEERAARKAKETAAAKASDVKGAETPEERAKRKAKEKAAAEASSAKVEETPEQRSKWKEREKAAIITQAQTASAADKADAGEQAARQRKEGETPEQRAKRKALEKAAAEQGAANSGSGTVPLKKPGETPEERLKRKEAEKAAILKKAQAAQSIDTDIKVPSKKPDETPEERSRRKELEKRAMLAKAKAQAGTEAGGDDTSKAAVETPEERSKRKPGEAAAKDAAPRDNSLTQREDETAEERSRRREKDKAASAAAAGLITADKADKRDAALRAAETPEKRAARKAKEKEIAQGRTGETRARSAPMPAAGGKETPEEMAKKNALQATPMEHSTGKTETPEERLARKVSERDKSLANAGSGPVAEKPISVGATVRSAPLDKTQRAEMERLKAELRAQRLAAAAAKPTSPPATAPIGNTAASHPSAAVTTAPTVTIVEPHPNASPAAPASASLATTSSTPAVTIADPPTSAPVQPSDDLMAAETSTLKSVLKKPKKGYRQKRNIHHNQFLTMRAHRAALVPFPHGLHPPPHSPPHTLWWRNIPKDASHLMTHPAVPKVPEGLKPGEDEDLKRKDKEKEKAKEEKVTESKKEDKDKEAKAEAKDPGAKEKVASSTSSKPSGSSSSRSPEEEKARALANAKVAKEAEVAKAATANGASKPKAPEAEKSRSSSSSSRPVPAAGDPLPLGPKPMTPREKQLEKAQLAMQLMLCALVFFLHEQLALCLFGFFAYQHITEKRTRAAELIAVQAAAAATAAKRDREGSSSSDRAPDLSQRPDKPSSSSRSKPEEASSRSASGRTEAAVPDTTPPTRPGTTSRSAGEIDTSTAPVNETRQSQLRPLVMSADPDAQASREIRRQERVAKDLKNIGPSADDTSTQAERVINDSVPDESQLDAETEARIIAKLEKVPPEKREKYEEMMRAQAVEDLKKRKSGPKDLQAGVTEDEIAARMTSMGTHVATAPSTKAEDSKQEPESSALSTDEDSGRRNQRKLQDVPPEKRAKYEKVYRERMLAGQAKGNEGVTKEAEGAPTKSVAQEVQQPSTPPKIPINSMPAESSTTHTDAELEKEVQRKLQKVPEEKRAKYAIIIRQKLLAEREVSRQDNEAAEPTAAAAQKPPAHASEAIPSGETSMGSDSRDEQLEEKVQRQLQNIPQEKRERYAKIFWQKALAERAAKEREVGLKPAVQSGPSPDDQTTTTQSNASESSRAHSAVRLLPTSKSQSMDDLDIEEKVQRQLLKVPPEKRRKYEKIFWQKALAERDASQMVKDVESEAPPTAPADIAEHVSTRPASPTSPSRVGPIEHIDNTDAAATRVKQSPPSIDDEIERYVQQKLAKVPPEKRSKYEKVYRDKALADRAAKNAAGRSANGAADTTPRPEVEGTVEPPAAVQGPVAAETMTKGALDPKAEPAQKQEQHASRQEGSVAKQTGATPEAVAAADQLDDDTERRIQRKLQQVPPEECAKYEKLNRGKALSDKTAEPNNVASQPTHSATHAGSPKAASSTAGPLASAVDDEIEQYVQRKLLKIPAEKRKKYEKVYRAKAVADKQARAASSRKDQSDPLGPVNESSVDKPGENNQRPPAPPSATVESALLQSERSNQPLQPINARDIITQDDGTEVEAYVKRKLEKIPEEKSFKYEKLYRDNALANKKENTADTIAASKNVGSGDRKKESASLSTTSASGQEALIGEVATTGTTAEPPATSASEMEPASLPVVDDVQPIAEPPSSPTIEALDPEVEAYVERKLEKLPPEKRARYEKVYRERAMADKATRSKASPVVKPVAVEDTKPDASGSATEPEARAAESFTTEGTAKLSADQTGTSLLTGDRRLSSPTPTSASSSEPDPGVEAYVRRKLEKVRAGKRAKYEKVYRERAVADKAARASARSTGEPAAPSKTVTSPLTEAPLAAPVVRSRADDSATKDDIEEAVTTGVIRSTTGDGANNNAVRRSLSSAGEKSAGSAQGLEVSLPGTESESSTRSTTPIGERAPGSIPIKDIGRERVGTAGQLEENEGPRELKSELKVDKVDPKSEAAIEVTLATMPPEKEEMYQRRTREKALESTNGTAVKTPSGSEAQVHVKTDQEIGGTSTQSLDTPRPVVADLPKRTISSDERKKLEQLKAKRREERMRAATESPEVLSADSVVDTTARRQDRPRATPLQPASPPSPSQSEGLPAAGRARRGAIVDSLEAVPESATLPALPADGSDIRSSRLSSEKMAVRRESRKHSADGTLDVQRVREALRRVSETDNESVFSEGGRGRARRSSSVGERSVISFSGGKSGLSLLEGIPKIQRSTTPEGEPRSAPMEWSRPNQQHPDVAEITHEESKMPPSIQVEGGNRGRSERESEREVPRVTKRGARSTTPSPPPTPSALDKGKGRVAPEMLRQHVKEGSRLVSDTQWASRGRSDKYGDNPSGTDVSKKSRELRLTPEQIVKLPADKREKYERYMAVRAKATVEAEVKTKSKGSEPAVGQEGHAENAGRDKNDDEVMKEKKGREQRTEKERMRDKGRKIRLEDLTPEQIERMQRAREVRKREAARAAKEAEGQGSSGLSMDEKEELSAS